MKKSSVVKIAKFRETYARVGWPEKRSKDGRYIIWTSPRNASIWVRLPVNEDAIDYTLYAKKNVLMLLYALNIPETQSTAEELISQLRAYNYKLINRIVSDAEFKADSVPYELATLLPQKNIEAFRHYYLTRKTKKRSIPINRFQLNHTEEGSFVIPVSILVDEDKNATLMPTQNETNIVIHDYLNMVDSLLKIAANNPVTYAEKVVGESIDSKIVKDFLGRAGSIAKSREKYSHEIKEVSISSKGSLILDYGLERSEQEFKEIDLGGIDVLGDDYIKELEKLEIAADKNKVEETQATINVVIDNIDRNGRVKFTVTAINNEEINKPFKAYSNELTKTRLDQFADYFKNEGSAIVTGDITKATGRMGKINLETIGAQEDPNAQLL